MDGYYNPHMQNNNSQINSRMTPALVNHMNQMNHINQMNHMNHMNHINQMNPLDQRLLEQENILGKDMHIPDTFSEGYLSPASAIAQGWTPQVVFVPSSMIHMIPSPMTASMITSPLLPPENHIPPEAMPGFNHGNAGLGLLNAEVNPQKQEMVQSSFEEMLSSLGLLPNNSSIEPHSLDNNFHKLTTVKGSDRTLYKCPWAGCEKSKNSRETKLSIY